MTGVSRRLGVDALAARPIGAMIGLVVLAVVLATIAAAVLEQWIGIADASPVYLIPVVLAAGLLGTWAAIWTSVGAFLAYDFLFTTPRLTLAVSDPAEWLSLLLFLIVAVVIGRLTALLRDRAEEADRRVREGVALVAMSRDVAMTATFEEAAAEIALRLLVDAEMDAVWVVEADAPERPVAWTGSGVPATAGTPWTLMRSPQDESSDWLRLHEGAPAAAGDDVADAAHYVVTIEGDEGVGGWIHAIRGPGDPRPGRGARRLLVLAADQLGIALRRDRLRADLTAAEVARQSDALRAAILDSVSHDLRTPVASIRALAGGLADAAGTPDQATVRSTAAAIDAEGARLGDLIDGLLDMGRIQAGALRPDLRPYDLADLVEMVLRHHPGDPELHPVDAEVPDDLAPVLADGALFDVALGNVVENAVGHTPAGSRVRVRARQAADGWLIVDVDDAGPGVPPDALPHLFDRFYRVRAGQEAARHGMGLGLAIARGFVEAMGGTIAAQASPLGGLGVRIRLPAAPAEDPG